jgi:hypothetical protein
MYYHVSLLYLVRTQFGSLSKQFSELSEKFKFTGVLESWSKCSTGRRHGNFKAFEVNRLSEASSVQCPPQNSSIFLAPDHGHAHCQH